MSIRGIVALVALIPIVLMIPIMLIRAVRSWWCGDPPGTFARRVADAKPAELARLRAQRERPAAISEAREPE